LIFAGLLTGLIVISFSRITSAWQLVALWGLLGFVGLQAGQLYTAVPLAKWFIRRRARAASLVFLGTPLGVMIWSPTVQWLISTVGWQTTWVIMASTGGTMVALIGLLIIRRQPEDMGLLPDGDPQEAPAEAADGTPEADGPAAVSALHVDHSWTRAETVRSVTFWKLSLAFGMQVFGIGSLVIFRIPYFVGKGFAQSTVAWGLSSEGVSAILVALFLGFFMERVPVRYLGATGFLIMVTSAIVTMAATQTWQMVSAFFLFGMAIAILNVVQNTLWPAYFGRENVGTIRGMALLISLPFAATGAPAAGFVQDATGSYFQVWWIAIALMLASAALMFTTPPPSGKQTAV